MANKKQKRRARRNFDEGFKRDVVHLCEAASIGTYRDIGSELGQTIPNRQQKYTSRCPHV